MPDINTMKSSRFLKKEDCGNGILLTIRTCEQMNVAMEGAPEELKWCLTFEETDKPYVTNSTNRQLIAQFSGKPNTDHWAGVKIVLWNNPAIGYGGKLTGGISARAPRGPAPAARPAPAAAAPAADAPAEEDVPF